MLKEAGLWLRALLALAWILLTASLCTPSQGGGLPCMAQALCAQVFLSTSHAAITRSEARSHRLQRRAEWTPAPVCVCEVECVIQ